MFTDISEGDSKQEIRGLANILNLAQELRVIWNIE